MGEARGELLARLVEAASRVVAERAAELDALDAAIGDGDHGTNLARGLAAASAAMGGELRYMPLGRALRSLGEVVERETGGDGGRMYGALFRGMGDVAPEVVADATGLARVVAGGVVALRQAGGGTAPGDKTMVDVLQPVADALQQLTAEGRTDAMGGRVMAAAAYGLHRTSRLPASRGQAADIGEAAVNHLDPGAWSSALLVGAVVGVLEGGTPATAA